MPLGTEVGVGLGNIVLDGHQAPVKRAQPPNFLPMSTVTKRLNESRCDSPKKGGTALHFLDTEVSLGPGDIILDEELAPSPFPPKNGTQPPPIFGTCLLWPNGSMDQYATWYGGRPRPRRHCVRWGPSPPKGHSPSPQLLAHVYCSQTVAHLSYC